ncbi:multidrug transporter [Endozoicomonas lisbonensis]|uniref:Peroxiredoxin n=1 Tax=Endozoicomonas lisbonensis TaxID=3120522 RepID=A0ABV2SJ19_9GAMM
MSDYLLIESRDPFDSGCSHYHQLAEELVKSGRKVTLLLVQNGVLPARPCDASRTLTDMSRQGVEILADDFSLQERGIDPGSLAEGIMAAPLDVVIEQMVQGRKVLWH